MCNSNEPNSARLARLNLLSFISFPAHYLFISRTRALYMKKLQICSSLRIFFTFTTWVIATRRQCINQFWFNQIKHERGVNVASNQICLVFFYIYCLQWLPKISRWQPKLWHTVQLYIFVSKFFIIDYIQFSQKRSTL